MREILFRGKRLDNGEWVYGNYSFADCFAKHQHYIFQNKAFEHAVDPATVGQFTGLPDKDGTRIFEGDVVCYGNRTGYVIFGNGCFCVQDSMSRHHPAIDMVMFQRDVIVIGNIHDSELLEVTPDA